MLNANTIMWPAGVGPGKPLQQGHDLDQVAEPTCAGRSDWRQMFARNVQVSDMQLDA